MKTFGLNHKPKYCNKTVLDNLAHEIRAFVETSRVCVCKIMKILACQECYSTLPEVSLQRGENVKSVRKLEKQYHTGGDQGLN